MNTDDTDGRTRNPAPLDSSSPAPAGPATPRDLKGWIVKGTGVLLVVPALLNAGYDVYAAVLKLPRTDAEKANTELFRKYFNKAPLATLPVPIKSNDGTVDAKFAVYEDGEIYVEYGKHSQWFPFPKSEPPRRTSMNLISSAYAQAAPAWTGNVPERAPIASQTDVIARGTLIRSRIYADGRTEQRKIDTRSGSTLSIDIGQIAKENIPDRNSPPATFRIAPIDLRKLRADRQDK